MSNIGICVRCEKDFNRWLDETICGSCSEELWYESYDDLKRVELKNNADVDPWDDIREAESTGN